MTILHSGGKFDKGVYKVSGGLHGVGVSVVNALSEWLIAEVYRDGFTYTQRYEQGKPKTSVTKGKKTNKHGTLVTFKADKEIFSDISYDSEVLCKRLRELAYLNKNLKIFFSDLRQEEPIEEIPF